MPLVAQFQSRWAFLTAADPSQSGRAKLVTAPSRWPPHERSVAKQCVRNALQIKVFGFRHSDWRDRGQTGERPQGQGKWMARRGSGEGGIRSTVACDERLVIVTGCRCLTARIGSFLRESFSLRR